MHTRLLNMLHDAANQHHFAVADGIHVNFYCVIKEVVQQHWRIVRYADRCLEVATQVSFVIDDFHRPTAENVRRTHHQRVANLFRFLNRHFDGGNGGVRRLFQFQTLNRMLEAFTVFRTVDGIRAGTDNRYASSFQRARQFQRGLTAVLDDNAFRLLNTHNFQHVFQSYRLEVETVRGVVVGGDGFRVTVNHNGFITVFAQRQRGVYTAVVEFDTLTDTVRAAAEHHDFFTIGGRIRFALFFISGVHVSGVGGELCRTSIHALVNRVQVILVAQLADFCFTHAREFCQTRIGKAFAFQLAQEFSVQASDAHFCDFLFQTHQLFNLYQEPAVNVGQIKYTVYRQARAEGISDIPDTLCASIFQFAADFSQRFRVVETHFRIEASCAHFQAAQRFLQGLLLRATNRHHFANRFHLGCQMGIG